MRRNITYPHNWVVVKEENNKQDNLRFGFWNPVDLMSCSNEEFSLPNIDVASNSEMKKYGHDHCSKLKLPRERNPNSTQCTSNTYCGTNIACG